MVRIKPFKSHTSQPSRNTNAKPMPIQSRMESLKNQPQLVLASTLIENSLLEVTEPLRSQ